MTTQPENISVTAPVSQAIGWTKRVLFQPFDLTKWMVIGFCAWLAGLGERGYNFHFPGSGRGGSESEVKHSLEQAREYVMSNLTWIIPLAAALLILLLALGLLFFWLSSRGQFLFLHCVASNKGEVEVPWRKFAKQSNSLFWFRLVLGLIGAVICLPLVGIIIVIVINLSNHNLAAALGIMAIIGLGLLLIVAAIVLGVIGLFTKDFVVPIMFLRQSLCLDAWAEFRPILKANVGRFVLYYLFQIVLALVIGSLILALVLVTCCIAGCLMAIPFLGTVLLLPALVFRRSYSLYYLAQYGPEYNAFPVSNP